MRTGLKGVRLPLDEGDPLPPEHDRRIASAPSFDELYRAEKRSLLRFVSAKGRREDAEDVVQQVFANVVASQQPDCLLTPTAYLRQAAQNVLRNTARSALRRGGEHVPIESLALPDRDPIAALEARDKLARIEKAVERLKPLTRQIFLARRLDGFTYAEIAQQTGLSVQGVEKQMSRALKQLSRHLLGDA